jgi:hypothetical protein
MVRKVLEVVDGFAHLPQISPQLNLFSPLDLQARQRKSNGCQEQDDSN